jgi:hypothetical protein
LAIILGCSNAHVPVEIVFEQGLRNLFIIRPAGMPGPSRSTGDSSLATATGHDSVPVIVANVYQKPVTRHPTPSKMARELLNKTRMFRLTFPSLARLTI